MHYKKDVLLIGIVQTSSNGDDTLAICKWKFHRFLLLFAGENLVSKPTDEVEAKQESTARGEKREKGRKGEERWRQNRRRRTGKDCQVTIIDSLSRKK